MGTAFTTWIESMHMERLVSSMDRPAGVLWVIIYA